MNKNLNCRTCTGKCNKKGFPSVSKFSYYCNDQRKVLTVAQTWGFARFTNKPINLGKFIGRKIRGFR